MQNAKQFEELADDHYRTHTIIGNGHGLHARVAVAIARCCMDAKCEVRLWNDRRNADGHSVLELLSLAAEPKSHLTIETRGKGARHLIEKLSDILSGDVPEIRHHERPETCDRSVNVLYEQQQ